MTTHFLELWKINSSCLNDLSHDISLWQPQQTKAVIYTKMWCAAATNTYKCGKLQVKAGRILRCILEESQDFYEVIIKGDSDEDSEQNRRARE